MQRALEQLQGALGVLGLLHVDPHERAVRLRLRADGAEVFDAQPLRDVEPHLCELQGHVGVGSGGLDAVERLEVGVAGGMRLGGVVHRFAQDVQARGDARRVQVREGGDAGVHGLAGDEARRDAARQPVPSDKAENAGLLAEPQEPGPQHQG